MSILITGANGMLAKAIKKEFKEYKIICTDVNEIDITKIDEIEKAIKTYKPEFIINCAAYTRSR